MIILIPMGGKGSRFTDAGYVTNKACIETTDRHSGNILPMILCAMKDIPGIDDQQNKIMYFTGINNSRFNKEVIPGD